MSRLPHFALSLLAAIHLLVFSICPVSSRIYETNDAIVIEVDDTRSSMNLAVQRPIRSARSSIYHGNPAAIPIPYALNPYYTGLYQQEQQPANIPFWPYSLLKRASSNTSADVEDEPPSSPQSKQQNIACGVGPASARASAATERHTPATRIIGGSDVKANSWPFMVGLKITGFADVFCGGSLISTTKILTSASCIEKFSLRAIKALTVLLGMDDQGDPKKDISPDAKKTRSITRAVFHKDYNHKTGYNDIAVLTFDPPVTYSKAISPVCLPTGSTAVDQFAGKNAAILGWGISEVVGGSIRARYLQKAIVNIFPTDSCKVLGAPYSDLKQQLCAGATGKDICVRDLGGPMVVQTKAGSTSWTQVGVSSRFSTDCSADAATPSIYTNVASFRNWINTYMND